MYFSEDRGKEPGETCGVLKASSQKIYTSLTRTRQRPNLMAGCEEKYLSPQCAIFKLPLQSLLHSIATQFSVPGTYINSFNGLPCPLGYWREEKNSGKGVQSPGNFSVVPPPVFFIFQPKATTSLKSFFLYRIPSFQVLIPTPCPHPFTLDIRLVTATPQF